MSSIKNVAVIGAAGNLGPAVVQALLDANFIVTALTRENSTSKFPPTIRVHKTDYASPESLAEAFKGQDAVVSLVASAVALEQITIIDAAAKAGIKRYIPSEFGLDTARATGGLAKISEPKVEVLEHLKKVAGANKEFTWTAIATNLFFDWGLQVGSVGFSPSNKSATLFDSGNEPFQGTNIATIGLSVAAVLQKPKETGNRYLFISSVETTQNKILKIFEEETDSRWTVKNASTDDSLKIGDEKFAKGDYSAFMDYLKVYFFKDGKGQSTFAELANNELGLPEEDLRETIKRVLKG